MTFDSCYFVYGRQIFPKIEEIYTYWNGLGYHLIAPFDSKIHVWTDEGDEILFDNFSEVIVDVGFGLQLWLNSNTTIFFSVKERGSLSTEEYSFDGLDIEENRKFVMLLSQRLLRLSDEGLLSGVIFDRKDMVLEGFTTA